MSIKDDFEKALKDYSAAKLPYAGNQEIQDGWIRTATELNMPIALWAAKWMAERIAQYHIDRYQHTGEATAHEIRQLAQEIGKD